MNLSWESQSWYALQIRPGREKVSALILRHKGYEEFLPMQRARHIKRRKLAERPLFPGYLFCRLPKHVLAPLVTTPGVIRVVGCGNRPSEIADDEINSIRRMVSSGLDVTPCAHAQPGKRVRVVAGPLTGVEGIVVQSVGRSQRLVVSITLLQRSVAVALDPSWVAEADEYRSSPPPA